MVHRHVQHFKPLAEDMSHCTRASGNRAFAACHSFEFHGDAANRYLLMEREPGCRLHLVWGLTVPADKAAPAADSKGKGNGGDANNNRASPTIRP